MLISSRSRNIFFITIPRGKTFLRNSHAAQETVMHSGPFVFYAPDVADSSAFVGASARRYVRLDFAFVINLKQWFRQAASRLRDRPDLYKSAASRAEASASDSAGRVAQLAEQLTLNQ